jgi:hypothetical protein
LVAEAPQDGKNGTLLSARVAPRQPGPRQPGGRGVQYLKSNIQVSGNAACDSRELDNEEKFASRQYRTSGRGLQYLKSNIQVSGNACLRFA